MRATEESVAVGRPLLEFASMRIDEGQGQLAHDIKLKLGASGQPAAEWPDYSKDDPFLSPVLFAFLSEPKSAVTLDQILYGTLPKQQRPAELEAYADCQGFVDLQCLGQLVGGVCDQIVTVAPADLLLRAGGSVSEVEFVECSRIEGTNIEYAARLNPLFAPICEKACPHNTLGAGNQEIDHSEAISRALEIIQAVDAEMYRCLLAVTRQIVSISSENGESFATLAAHGAVFLHTPPNCDEVFFVEDLAHQGGHVLFNAITLDRGELIRIPGQTPLRELTGDVAEERTLFVVLHGLFTECLMSMVLAGSLRMGCFDKRQHHELQGRLSLIMKRLQLDLGCIRDLNAFTPLGRSLLDSFEEIFDSVYRSAESEIVGCDLRNQPYSFCYDRFAELNP